jgi:SAM-dependent methyltransferase
MAAEAPLVYWNFDIINLPMASSFASQIPIIVNLLTRLKPSTVLDVGKGFGKYGFLIHEYIGIDSRKRPNPELTLTKQSEVAVDAVEVNADYMWPHLCHFYREVHVGLIEDLYSRLPMHDLVLMVDVIEHLNKADGLRVTKHFVAAGSWVIVATPRDFFNQDLFESPHEHHVSHWTPRDFDWCHHDHQASDGGRVFLLSAKPFSIRGFGNRPLTKARRLARALRDCLG